jgi:hypothetical protein
MPGFKGVKCFFLTPIAKVRLRLRRYSFKDNRPCVDGHEYHNAEATLHDEDQPLDQNRTSGDLFPHDDPAWPKKCDRCDYEFVDEDHWQLNPDRLYESSDDQEPMTIHEAPPGAMWYADWYHFEGPDGHCLVVRCPNGCDWIVDSQASNCNRRDEKHWCWYREGTPPDVTIVHPHPKSCTAGAGSIGIGPKGKNYYHGFLRNGALTDG